MNVQTVIKRMASLEAQLKAGQDEQEDAHKPDILGGLHPDQLRFATSLSKRKAAVCSRRAGKTYVNARILVDAAEKNPAEGEDDAIVVYLSLSKSHAKRSVWGKLQSIAGRMGINIRFNNSELIGYHENGCQIWICGADDQRDIERLRGFAFRLVIVDEAQLLGAYLDELIDEVLEPALGDFDGTLLLTGTPHPACVGLFHDVCTGQKGGWETFHWTLEENPYYPRWRRRPDWREAVQEYLQEVLQRKGWQPDHPVFLREYKGLWVRDHQSLVYAYEPERNDYDAELPRSPMGSYAWRYVVGVDLGTVDWFAIVVWAWCPELPYLYEVETIKTRGETISDWAYRISAVREQYQPLAIVADAGALGAAIVKEFQERFGLPVEAAEKTEKAAAIAAMNSDLLAGHVKVRKGGPLSRTYSVLQWSDDLRQKEDPRIPNDDSDAALYAYRRSRHYWHRHTEREPAPGTPEHGELVARRMRAQRMKGTKRPWYSSRR